MANYYATARSNYFRVKDLGAFRAEVEKKLPDLSVHENTADKHLVCLLADQGDGGGWPPIWIDDEEEMEEAMDVPEFVAGHLADGEVAVFVEAGAEKLRYVSGHAVAINAAGERAEIVLDDIYELAEALGENVTKAMY